MLEFPFMKLALEKAEEAYVRDEVPVGAVIIDKNTKAIIAAESNRVEELKDPTAHAEILAIRKACEVMQSTKLVDCILYVSLEPCAMCAQAIAFARLHTLYYGASDPKMGGIEQGAKVFNSGSCHHQPEMYSGIMEAASRELMQRFFKAKR